MLDVDPERLRFQGASAWRLAKKAINQWLDAPEGRTPQALFIVGCQRSGTTMLIDTLMRAPDLWVHPEKSALAYDDFRLRSPATVEVITRLTPASTVIYKPLCDAHLTDRILAAHRTAHAWWVVRDWRDVANSAVRKWGSHQRDVIVDLAAGRGEAWGWRTERVPEAMIAQLKQLVTADLTPEAGAALFWYVRNSFYFSLGLDADPRVTLVRYEDLVSSPEASFRPLFAQLGVSADPAWTADIVATSVGKETAPDISREVTAVCDALLQRFVEARAAS